MAMENGAGEACLAPTERENSAVTVSTEIRTRTLALNLGPQHPAMHGTLRLRVELDGEIIVRADPEIGFLHTGFEKLAEHQTWNQWVTVTDRANYLSSLSNNIGYTQAVEELLGVELPPRGQYARVLMAELSRIADHIICVGLQAMDTGAFSVMLWTFIEREKMYDLFEHASGARMTTSWTRVGGFSRELPENFAELVREKTAKIEAVVEEVEKMLDGNRIWLDRTREIGIISGDEAVAWGWTGPCLRASGVPYDLRRVRPYLVYPELDFDVVVHRDGDSYSRYKVRCEEIRQSLKIIRQCLEKMPKSGPLSVDDPRVALPAKAEVYESMEALIHHFELIMPTHGIQPPVGEHYSATEAPNGELGFLIVSNGTGKPHRVRIRPPSLLHHQALPKLIEGRLISDAIAILSSFNVIAGELDR